MYDYPKFTALVGNPGHIVFSTKPNAMIQDGWLGNRVGKHMGIAAILGSNAIGIGAHCQVTAIPPITTAAVRCIHCFVGAIHCPIMIEQREPIPISRALKARMEVTWTIRWGCTNVGGNPVRLDEVFTLPVAIVIVRVINGCDETTSVIPRRSNGICAFRVWS